MDDEERIREIIDSEIGPGLASDGLELELVSVVDGIVQVRIGGLPESAIADRYHLHIGILQRLKEDVPDLKNVESV